MGLLFIVGAWSNGQTPVPPSSVKIEDAWYLLEDAKAYQQALALCETGLQQTSPHTQPALFAQWATAKGNALRQLGRPLEAVPFHLNALAIRRRLNDPKACLGTCQNLATCWLDKNSPDSAWAYIEEGSRHLKALPEPALEGGFWETIGNYWEAKQDWDKTIRFWEKALATPGADDSIGLSLSLAAVWGLKGAHKRASDLIAPYLAAVESFPDQRAAIFRAAGLCARGAGQDKDAVEYLERAFEAAKDSTEQSEIALELGDSYLEMGDFSAGIALFEKTLKYTNIDPEWRVALLQRLALGLRYRGEGAAAAQAIGQALALLPKTTAEFGQKTRPVLGLTLGGCYLDANEPARALACVSQYQDQTADKHYHAAVCLKMGQCYAALQKLDSAQAWFRQSLHTARQSGAYDMAFAAAYQLGTLASLQENWDEALICLAQARRLLGLEGDEMRSFEKVQLENAQIRALCGKARPKQNPAEWLTVLRASEAAISDLERLQGGFRREASQLNLQDLFYWPYHASIEALSKLGRPEAAFNMAMRYKAHVLRRLSPKGAALGTLIPNIPTLKKQLRPEEALVDYVYGDHGVFAAILRPDTFVWLPLSKPLGMDSTVKRFVGWCGHNPNLPLKDQERVAAYQYLCADGKALYKALFQPLMPHTAGATDLIVVPDGLLWYLPFEALIADTSAVPGEYKASNWLADRFSISYGQNAGLITTGPRTGGPKDALSLLALAPIFDGRQRAFRPLAQNVVEAKGARRLLGGRLLEGRAATPDALLAQGRNAQVLLCSSHAYFNRTEPGKSALVLSDGQSDSTYAPLTVETLDTLRLKADLVLLSACETGLGKLYRGEGLMSLSRAFLHAGAGSVVASRWNADDEHTPILTTEFLKRLSAGARCGTALSEARRTYWGQEDVSQHPFYWAGLMLVGRTDPIPGLSNPAVPLYVWPIVVLGVAMLGIFVARRRKRTFA